MKLKDLTEAELKELQDAARDTWGAIGYDVLQASADGTFGKKTVDQVLLSRKAVIEIVLDADHIRTNNPRLSERVVKFLRESDYKDLIKAVKPAFPYTRYGT